VNFTCLSWVFPLSFFMLAVACLAYLHLSLYPISLFKKVLLKLSLSCCSDPARYSNSNKTLHPLLQIHIPLKSKAQKNTTPMYHFGLNLLCWFKNFPSPHYTLLTFKSTLFSVLSFKFSSLSCCLDIKPISS